MTEELPINVTLGTCTLLVGGEIPTLIFEPSWPIDASLESATIIPEELVPSFLDFPTKRRPTMARLSEIGEMIVGNTFVDLHPVSRDSTAKSAMSVNQIKWCVKCWNWGGKSFALHRT